MDGMSGRAMSVASVFDWTDALPRNRTNHLSGRFIYRNGRSMTKGELEILTGIYNNRIEKKSKYSQMRKPSPSVQEKMIKLPENKKICNRTPETNAANISDPPKTIVNIRLPRIHSPPAAPCSSPEITRQSSSEDSR